MLPARGSAQVPAGGDDDRLDAAGLECVLQQSVEVRRDEDLDQAPRGELGEALMRGAGLDALEVLRQVVAPSRGIWRDELQMPE